MTRWCEPSIYANDPSVQVYFEDLFANDSAFPLDPGDECVAWVESGAVVISPIEDLAANPDAWDGPPPDAIPGDYRDAFPGPESFDPELVEDGDDTDPDTTDPQSDD